MARSSDRPMPKRLPARLRNALFAEWSKFSPTLAWDCTEREARLRFANEVLFPRHPTPDTWPLKSWNDLTSGQAKRLLREMKERSGSNAAWRALKLAEVAAELFGPDWNAIVQERLWQRFRAPSPQHLAPREFWAEVEELLSRLARQRGEEIETIRARLFGKKKGAGPNPAPNPPEASRRRFAPANTPAEEEQNAGVFRR